ncbi:ubiquitin carboxyl-terminal hydrolase 4 [Limosa lapponica baueri]|uniref:Ubiquitin carboxyl-terminal hydrolase 4 n=1 Tax=Limosa lapponica baueri TaxID=1758121 RepID=A0A2I0T878_LIMLA|nr:ubiquitin carboxyl-terminal hydrolase 4 [Limosa lapponica baueri]
MQTPPAPETLPTPVTDIVSVQTPLVPATTTVSVQTLPIPTTDIVPVQTPPAPAIDIVPVQTSPALPTDPDLIQTLLAFMTRPAAATSTKSAPTLVMDDAADLQTQSVSVSVNPVHKRKRAVASDSDSEPGTPGNAVTEETTRSLTLSELQDIHGREAKWLAPLARESGIDRALGRPPQSLTLWRRLLLSVRSRYRYRDNIMYQPSKWTTIERGVKNLREIAVQEMIFSDLDDLQTSLDPDALQITVPIWRKWASVSVLKKSFGKANISVGDKCSPTKPGREKQSTPQCILWSALRNQGENIRNWDGKPTLALETRVHELWMPKPNGEWRLTVDYDGLNEVTPPLSADVPDMLELHSELESKEAKWAALNPFIPQSVLIPGIALTHRQYLALGLVELHKVRMGPILKPVKVQGV